MTVSSSTNRVSYSGNGTLTTFAYTFKVFDQGDLTVILRSSTGTETVQTITTHYTVTGVGDVGGGNVVFVTAPSATETVVILREQDLTQGLDLVPNDPFPAQSLEESLDKLTFMVQQHEEELGRAIKASRTNTLTGSEFTISAADRANKVFAFDSSGDLSVTQELGTFKGDWAASTAYVERDLVKDTTTNDVFIVNSAHTSSGSLPLTTNTNSAKYEKIIDISNPPGDLTVGGNISTSGSVTAGNFIIGSADINENDLEAIDSVTAGTVAASKAVVVDVNKDISSFRNLTATGDITFGGLSDGTITVTAFVDEDNMASDSATLVPTQQSVKAYVDAQVATADALSEVLGNGNTTGGTNLVISSGDTLDVDGALDASGTISLGGNFPTGTDNVALGSSALGAVVSAGERNTIIGSAAGDGITNGDDNTALGAGALGSITTQSSNTAVGRNALTSTTGTANTALGNGAGSQITSGQYNTVIGLFNGNQNSLDIRTSSNNVVLSDGQGNVRFYANSSGNVGFGSVSPDAELHISSSSSTPKIIIENSINPRGNFIGVENNGDLVLGADEDSLSGSSSIKFKVDGTQVMSLDYQGTLALTGNATFGDNDKAIFGAGSDLQIYHDGSNSYLTEAGAGNLYIGGENHIFLTNSAGTQTYAAFNGPTGWAKLYYSNSEKLATTSTGIDVTGIVTADGLTVDGDLRINTTSGKLTYVNDIAGWTVDMEDGTSDLYIRSGVASPTDRLKIEGNGDISFYEDTGTTAKFFWDASAENLLLGTTADAGATNGITIYKSAGTAGININANVYGADYSILAGATGADKFGIYDNDAAAYRMVIDNSGNVGIGTSSPSQKLEVSDTTNQNVVVRVTNNDGNAEVQKYQDDLYLNLNDTGNIIVRSGSPIAERLRVDASGNLLVGLTSSTDGTGIGCRVRGDGFLAATREGTSGQPTVVFNKKTNDGEIAQFQKDGSTVGSIGVTGSGTQPYFVKASTGGFKIGNDVSTALLLPVNADGSNSDGGAQLGTSSNRFKDLYLSGSIHGDVKFENNAGTTEYARFDSSGNLLVGKTVNDNSTVGTRFQSDGFASLVRDGDASLLLRRNTSDGTILRFNKAGTDVGSIGSYSGAYVTFGSSDTGLVFVHGNDTIRPFNPSAGAERDNAIDMGSAGTRFDDIYATNGTIQTSDRNEKQDIAELTDAEQRVAVAAKGLLRKFRWKDAVAEKGDEARTHFGIIAQDLQAAFAAEGLDAGDYAMFIHSTWTDEETGEERSRMGVRYSELLAFIIAAI
jgi:hypothetical protein